MSGFAGHRGGSDASGRLAADGDGAPKKNCGKGHGRSDHRGVSAAGHHQRRRERKADRKSFYEEHYSEAELAEGVRDGTFFIGRLKVFAQKRKTAYVTIPGIDIDVIVPDELSRNRAHPGDEVYVEIAPQSEWTTDLPDDDVCAAEIGEYEGQKIAADESIPELWNVKWDTLKESQTNASQPQLEARHETHEIERAAKSLRKQPSGRVVGIHEESHRRSLVGSLKATQCTLSKGRPLPTMAMVFFVPMDKRFADMIVPRTELPDAYTANPFEMEMRIYLADLDSHWAETSKCATARNLRTIGEVGNIYAETEALLTEFGVNHPPFDEAALLGDTLGSLREPQMWSVPPEELEIRRDFRSHRVFTIDPYSARDLDDALHITELSDGLFEVGVHIADVSYFVREGTALDDEAKRRGTSIYLVQKVIPMLPPLLCEHLCSLNANVDRLAYSCVWKMKADGTLVDEPAWFGKSVIRSCAKLDYATAQRMVDGLIPCDPPAAGEVRVLSEELWESARRPWGADRAQPEIGPDGIRLHAMWEVVRDVKRMHMVAMRRRELRMSHGAVSLNRSKITFRLNEEGNPVGVGTYEIRDTNKMVEEYMLLANYLVAEELVVKARPIAFLRRHESPDPTNKGLAELKNVTDRLGVSVDVSTATALQHSLNRLSELDGDAKLAVESLLMRVMKTAEYFVVGSKAPEEWRHFALGIPYYTHFTSPIRRYADLVVHRLLFASTTHASSHSDQSRLEDRLSYVAEHCNMCKKIAGDAEDRCDTVFLSVFLSGNASLEDAVVIGIGRKSFTVLVRHFGIEYRIFTDDMHGFDAVFDSASNTLKISKTRLAITDSGGFDRNKDIADRILQFEEVRISLLTKVRVYVSSANATPIDVRVCLHSVII
jgi:DIS3-like exonuclease 2